MRGTRSPAGSARRRCLPGRRSPRIVAEVDADRIRQALDNLVDNALHFAPRGTQVVISARRADDREGSRSRSRTAGRASGGLPASCLRTLSASRQCAGPQRWWTGLGLAIVSAVARAHGGQAMARNRDDGGAIVSITVPGRQVTAVPGVRNCSPSSEPTPPLTLSTEPRRA